MKTKKLSVFMLVQSLFCLGLLLAGVAMAQAPMFQPVGTVLQIMQGVVVPNSDVVFKVTSKPPKDDKDWAAIQNSALTLAEAGNLLLIPGRAAVYKSDIDADLKKGNGDWVKYAKALTVMSTKAFHAASAKDIKELDTITDDIEATCENCHAMYHPQK